MGDWCESASHRSSLWDMQRGKYQAEKIENYGCDSGNRTKLCIGRIVHRTRIVVKKKASLPGYTETLQAKRTGEVSFYLTTLLMGDPNPIRPH